MYITNRICARANARSSSTLCKSSRLVDEREREGIDFFSFCHHHPFDPAFADIPSLFSSLSGKKGERQSIGRSHARVYIPISLYIRVCAVERDAPLWTAWEESIWGMGREKKKEKKRGKRICSRRDASVRLGPARLRSARSTGNFQSAFRVSAFGGGGKGGEGMSVFASPC